MPPNTELQRQEILDCTLSFTPIVIQFWLSHVCKVGCHTHPILSLLFALPPRQFRPHPWRWLKSWPHELKILSSICSLLMRVKTPQHSRSFTILQSSLPTLSLSSPLYSVSLAEQVCLLDTSWKGPIVSVLVKPSPLSGMPGSLTKVSPLLQSRARCQLAHQVRGRLYSRVLGNWALWLSVSLCVQKEIIWWQQQEPKGCCDN